MVNQELYEEIKAYCKLNNIEDVDQFVDKMLREKFTTIKWGSISTPIPENKVEEVKKVEVEPVKESKPIKPKNSDLYGE